MRNAYACCVFVILVTLFLPVVDATHTPEVQYDVREYTAYVRLFNMIGALAQENVNIPNPPHEYTVNSRASVWIFHDNADLAGDQLQTRSVKYQWEVDNVDISNCEWRYRMPTGSNADGENPHRTLTCANSTAVNPGTHSIELKAEVVNVNPVQFRRLSIELRQRENVTIPPQAAVIQRLETLAEGAETIAVSIDHWFWLALIAGGFLVARLRTPTTLGLAGLLSVIALFWALERFNGMTAIIGLAISLLSLGHAVAEAFAQSQKGAKR